jgi:uncharacterized membrane protein YtjA (UPF0391 family)
MIRWVLLFLLISVIAGFFGFTQIAVASASIAKTIFFLFLTLFVIALVLLLMGK